MNDQHESRIITGLEVRDGAGKLPKLVGYASVFNSRSVDLGGFVEIVRPGAFKRTLQNADVRAMLNHDPNHILGRNKAGTLELREDDRGLRVEITPPAGDRVIESVRRGDLDGMSFGFRTVSDRWNHDEKPSLRELLDVDLFDVSVVAFPAYPRTDVALRSLQRSLAEISDETARRRLRLAELERALRISRAES